MNEVANLRRRGAVLLPASLVALLFSCAPESAPPEGVDDAALLREIGEEHHRFEVGRDLYLQLKYGEKVESLPDLWLEQGRRESETAAALLARLQKVRPEGLTPLERLVLESLRFDLEVTAEQVDHYWLRFFVTPRHLRNSSVLQLFTDFVFEDADDTERYLRLVAALPDWIDTVRAKLAGQAERGIRLPVAGIDMSLPVWRSLVRLLAVDAERLVSYDKQAAAAFQDELQRILDGEVQPALGRLTGYLDGEYREAAPTAVGCAQYPGGKEYYRYLVRLITTLDMDPDEIHRLGLERTAEINEKMAAVRRSLGFPGSREDFHRALKDDPRFYAKTPEEVEHVLRSYVEKIEPKIDGYFLRRPHAPYEIRRLDPALEGSMTYGFYWPTPARSIGTYYYNGSKLGERSLLGAESLVYHELIPGHHFQVFLQEENKSIPAYRRDAFYGSFTEGWANYAAGLGVEMGLYKDPYSLYGRLAAERLFAARLVVDTGMNYLGWTREEASRFLAENTLESDVQIDSETLRYAVESPAQALSYELGTQEFLRLRRKAEEALGDRFDIRELHEAFLGNGNLPFPALEKHVDALIERTLAR